MIEPPDGVPGAFAQIPPHYGPPFAPPSPPPSPFARLSPQAGSLLGQTFDLLTQAGRDLRDASLYIALIVLVTAGTFALLLWSAEISLIDPGAIIQSQAGAESFRGWLVASGLIALGGYLVASVESRSMAIALLASRLEDRALQLREVLERSRMTFWRVVAGTLIVNVPVYAVQTFLGGRLADSLGGESEVSEVSAALATAILATPLAYVLTGIVLGDVGAIEAARRSLRLFSVRKRAALVVSLVALATQFLMLAALAAGLEPLARIVEASGLGPGSDAVGLAVLTGGLLVLVFAVGSLTFTASAIAVAPQVIMFVALTHATPGLAAVREEPASPRRPVRWLTRPMIAYVVLGVLLLIGGFVSLRG